MVMVEVMMMAEEGWLTAVMVCVYIHIHICVCRGAEWGVREAGWKHG